MTDDKLKASAADIKQQEDFDDLQNETAGRDTGRIKRFFNENRGETKAERDRKHNNTAEFLSALDVLLQDPEYAKLYNDTKDLLRRAETAAESALNKAEATLEDIESRAAKLPNGTKVFMDKNGHARTEDGAIINVAIAEGIVWPDDAPMWEDREAVREHIDVIRAYQVDVLGHARERLDDEENPAQKDELEDLQKDMQEGLDQIVGHADVAQREPEPSHQKLTSDIGLPNLGN